MSEYKPRTALEAYEEIAALCRRQVVDVATAGWGFFDRRCAILNLKGLAECCDAKADLERTRIRLGRNE